MRLALEMAKVLDPIDDTPEERAKIAALLYGPLSELRVVAFEIVPLVRPAG